MRIETLFTPSEIEESAIKGKLTVVIDVLRASTTIAFAISNGCDWIIPVATVESATNLASSLDRRMTLLGGERGGKKIDGFDLGNSPQEYIPDVVENKSIILTTSNGTRAITACKGAKEILVASFVNISTVADHICNSTSQVVNIVCAGDGNHFGLDDCVCAGMLISEIVKSRQCDLSDGSEAARQLYDLHKGSIIDMLRNCNHGRHLINIGFESDIDICSRVDSLKVLPVVRDGRISAKRTRRK